MLNVFVSLQSYLSAVLHLYAGDRDSIMTSTLFVLTH